MPGGRSSQERLAANRKLTHWLIEESPSIVTLVPRIRTRQPGGGYKVTDGTPRQPQIFKLIYQGSSASGVINAGDNRMHEYDFVILGEWDAELEVGDQWLDDNGQNWVVEGLQPYNQYEVKAGLKSYGGKPNV